jgi:heme A synthase
MPGPLDQISYVVVGYAALVLLLAGYSWWRWRERPPWLDSMAWMLELLLVVRALAGVGAIAGGSRPDSMSTHLGYLVVSVCVVPIALGSNPEDRGPWSLGVFAVAVLAVGVVSVRMMMTQ